MQSQPEIDLRMETRIARIEQTCRRLGLGVKVAVGFAVLCVLLAAANEPEPIADTIEAQEFALYDSRGNIRAYFGITDASGNAGVCFQLLDEHSKPRIEAYCRDGAKTSGLAILDGAGKARVHLLASEPNKGNFVALADSRGKSRALLTAQLGELKVPAIALINPQGDIQAGLIATEDGGRHEVYDVNNMCFSAGAEL